MDLERILNCKLSPKKFSFTEDEIYVHDLQDKFGSYRVPDVHTHFFNIAKSERRIKCKQELAIGPIKESGKSGSRSRSSSRDSGKSSSKKKQKKSSPSFLKRKGSTKDVSAAPSAASIVKSKKMKRAVSIETYTLSQRAEELQKMKVKKEESVLVEGLVILKAAKDAKDAVSCNLEGLPHESISGELSVSISYGSDDEKKIAGSFPSSPSSPSPAVITPASPISGTGTISKTYSSSSSASSLRERRKFPQLTVDVHKSNSKASWTRSIMDQLSRLRLSASTRTLK